MHTVESQSNTLLCCLKTYPYVDLSLVIYMYPFPLSHAHTRTHTHTHTHRYNIEFTFDADARCAITIYYFVTESIEGQHAVYLPRDSAMSSETYRYKAGANQQFVQAAHILEPGRSDHVSLLANFDNLIHCARNLLAFQKSGINVIDVITTRFI